MKFSIFSFAEEHLKREGFVRTGGALSTWAHPDGRTAYIIHEATGFVVGEAIFSLETIPDDRKIRSRN